MVGTRTAKLGILLGLGILALPRPARSDDLTATLGEPLREISHAVAMRVVDGTAFYTVRRSFANAGGRHDEASLGIQLPYGAAVTGLRIRGARRWYRGELMEAERAAALYRELTGLGPHTPRDPALLEWVWADRVQLRVFPVPPARTATVEYTLTAPTRYVAGRHLLSYPGSPAEEILAPPVVRVAPQDPAARIEVNGQVVARDQPVVIQRPGPPSRIAQHDLDPSASHVVSSMEVVAAGAVKTIQVATDIRHTYRGDLRVQLFTPWGSRHLLHDRRGGGKNDLRRTFTVPLSPQKRPVPAKGTWQLVVSDHAGRDTGSLERWSLRLGLQRSKRPLEQTATDLPRFIPDAPEGNGGGRTVIAVSPAAIDTVAARLGRVAAAGDKQFLRLEVEAAPRLRPLPTRPVLVFVVDASHSIGPRGVDAQIDLLRSFVRHVPDARVELVLYRRRATRLLERFIPAGDLEGELLAARRAQRFACGNGSALDQGFRLAAGALRSEPGDRFIVMASDGLVRSSWRDKAALAARVRLPAGAVAHVVIPEIDPQGELTERRDDDHPLAPLAAAHGGVLLQIGGLPHRTAPKALDQVTLGLVRPVRIDGFTLKGVVSDRVFSLPDALEEGEGIREMVELERAPSRVVLAGKIWARPFRRVVRASEAFSRVTAAYLFSHDMHGKLTEAEMLKVARRGRAVSPVTSYLAIEPGVRPSTAGIEWGTVGRGGGGGAGYGSAAGRARAPRNPPDLKALVRAGITRCVARHRPGSGWSAAITVETTRDEVVDVILDSSPSPTARCIVEEIWAVRLTAAFDQPRETFRLALP